MTHIKFEKPAPLPDTISGSIPLASLKAAVAHLGSNADIKGKPSSIPALKCVTLSLSLTTCTVAHYGLDISIEKEIEGEGIGIVSLPYSQLSAFLSAASGDNVTITKLATQSAVALSAGRLKAEIVPVARLDLARDFTGLKPTRSIAFGDGVLSHTLALVAPVMSTEETRYYLNGVCLEFLQGRVLAIATDGHRLGVRGFDTPGTLEAWDQSVIVPNFAIRAISRLIAKKQGTAEFFYSGRGAALYRFAGDGWTIAGRAIDGDYPEWRRVIPQTPVAFAEVDAADLTRFAGIVSRIGIGAVALAVSHHENGLGLQYKNDGAESVFTTTIDAVLSGLKIPTIGLNAVYLSGIAKAHGTKRIRLAFISSGDPVTITAPDAPADELTIIMPMRL